MFYTRCYQLWGLLGINLIQRTEKLKQKKDGKITTTTFGYRYDDDKVFLQCKENDAIIQMLQKKNAEIEKLIQKRSAPLLVTVEAWHSATYSKFGNEM